MCFYLPPKTRLPAKFFANMSKYINWYLCLLVVHEMNGEDGGHVLSSFEVEELIHKADEASMKSQTITTVTTSSTTRELQQELNETTMILDKSEVSTVITGLEAKPEGEPTVSEATEENPVTMVFMGYQNVDDEDETKRVLGVQGTVKAELVVIEDVEGKTSPVEQEKVEKTVQKAATPPAENIPKEKETSPTKKNGETAANVEEVEENVRKSETEALKKEKKQPCKCCSIMWTAGGGKTQSNKNKEKKLRLLGQKKVHELNSTHCPQPHL